MTEIGTPVKPAPDLERRLATILCADIAGYSRMMGENEERTVRVFRGHREIFESLVEQHRGRIFNTAGDALLAEFTSAVEAVRCATDIQAALRTRNEHLAPEERMQFRIGVNLGDVIVQGNDLLGDGVNVAARIQQSTEPGGICISGSVHDQIQDKLSLEFKLIGDLPFKNIAKPVRTYTINDGGAATTAARKPPLRAIGLVAVAVAIAAAGTYWAYGIVQEGRAERDRIAAQLEAQRKAAADAQRAVEDAKREAQAQAQAQAANETLRRAQEERSRAEQERRLAEVEKKAAENAKTQAAAPPAATAPGVTRYDGAYAGRICNLPREKPPACWPVELLVRDGVARGGWYSPRGKKTASATGAVSADGVVRLDITGWTERGEATEATLTGRITDRAITVAGNWRDGGMVSAEWHRGAQRAAAVAATGAHRYDGDYDGRFCNHPEGKPQRCWTLVMSVRGGKASASWLSRTKNTATARGTVGNDGAVRLSLNAWDPRGDPIEGKVAGRAADKSIEAAGQWADGTRITGKWSRAQ